MLPRTFRLKRSGLFRKTMAIGKPVGRCPLFLMLGLPRVMEGTTALRFGFIVSKKVSNRAVRRNKLRRRLRELVRSDILPQQLEKLAPYSAVVFIVRQSALDASFAQMRQSLQTCMDRL